MTITVSTHILGFFITNAVIFVIHKQYLVITTGSSKYKKKLQASNRKDVHASFKIF